MYLVYIFLIHKYLTKFIDNFIRYEIFWPKLQYANKNFGGKMAENLNFLCRFLTFIL